MNRGKICGSWEFFRVVKRAGSCVLKEGRFPNRPLTRRGFKPLTSQEILIWKWQPTIYERALNTRVSLVPLGIVVR